MKSSTRDAPHDGVPADALTRIARLARFTAEIAAEILAGFPGC